MSSPDFVLHVPYQPDRPALEVTREFVRVLEQRRSVRDFSPAPVERELIEAVVAAAASAPSGANKQPWTFVCVQDPEIKRKIRLAAEVEEREFYESRATESWKADLAPLGTDEHKEFLEVAPWLVVVFRHAKDPEHRGGGAVYYSEESVGIATGMLLAAAQLAGLATLTHTPSPMGFLAKVLERPANERAYMLIPMGWPADECRVPAAALVKKQLGEVAVFR
ncbi:MAG: nitroreductase family protein [Planctomycetota bacterium]|nr:nitroreductase family protein [Planctomycetota bacterium]